MQEIFAEDDWNQEILKKQFRYFSIKNWAYLLKTIKFDGIIKYIHSSSALR